MENIGCVTITEQLLFRSKVTDAMYELRAMVILHEMAHMWFGDLVTMRWWGDLWLNESFAEFCATLSSAEATRFTGAWTTFASGRKTWGYMQDQLPSTHPVAADVRDAERGGSRTSTGSATPRARRCSSSWSPTWAGTSSSPGCAPTSPSTPGATPRSPTCSRALEASSGRNLADWSKAWLETAGPNTLRPEFAVDDDGRVHRVRGRCRRPRPRTRRCARTTSRSACTTGAAGALARTPPGRGRRDRAAHRGARSWRASRSRT